MNTIYAKPVYKMSNLDKYYAERQAVEFAAEVDKTFVNIEKLLPRSPWSVTLVCEDGNEVGASIVRCPHCKEVQICWGEYGDPATEVTICTDCKETYEVEPF